MAESLGAVCSALPYIHALTGCDSVSSFFAHSKKKAFKTLKRLPDSDVTELSSAEFEPRLIKLKATEKFVCKIYGAKSNRINEARYELFKAGDSAEERLPPNMDCLHLRVRRACYQAAVWLRALEPSPTLPAADGHGRVASQGDLMVCRQNKEVAPNDVLKVNLWYR